MPAGERPHHGCRSQQICLAAVCEQRHPGSPQMVWRSGCRRSCPLMAGHANSSRSHQAWWPSGKAELCKSSIRWFDSDPGLNEKGRIVRPFSIQPVTSASRSVATAVRSAWGRLRQIARQRRQRARGQSPAREHGLRHVVFEEAHHLCAHDVLHESPPARGVARSPSS